MRFWILRRCSWILTVVGILADSVPRVFRWRWWSSTWCQDVSPCSVRLVRLFCQGDVSVKASRWVCALTSRFGKLRRDFWSSFARDIPWISILFFIKAKIVLLLGIFACADYAKIIFFQLKISMTIEQSDCNDEMRRRTFRSSFLRVPMFIS